MNLQKNVSTPTILHSSKDDTSKEKASNYFLVLLPVTIFLPEVVLEEDVDDDVREDEERDVDEDEERDVDEDPELDPKPNASLEPNPELDPNPPWLLELWPKEKASLFAL